MRGKGTRRRRRASTGGAGSARARRLPSREELLRRVAEDLLQHGVADFSLRAAGERVGASARMLVHHFGSKERLLGDALALLRVQQVEHFARTFTAPPSSFDDVFQASWQTLSGAQFRRYFVLNHELLGIAMRDPRRFASVLKTTTEDWRSGFEGTLVARGFTPEESRAASTLYIAALRGLLLDLAVTRDRARVDGALGMLAATLKADLDRHTPASDV
jgi:AcrR family transcriptional regulator